MVIVLLGVIALSYSVIYAQDTTKTPAIKNLWRLSDSLSRFEAKGSDEPTIATYIYINDFEIRHEILIPFYILEDWIQLDYDNAFQIDTVEQMAMHRPIEKLFIQKNAVIIDGLLVQPILNQIDFIAPQYIDSIQINRSGPIDAYTSWVGIILSYSTKGVPGLVEVNWDMFSHNIPAVKSIIYAFEDKSEFIFSADENTYQWDNPGRPPIPPINEIKSKEKAGWQFWKSDTTEKKAGLILETLLKNIYRAFDYKSESDIYDALALSVTGELLDKIYLQIRRSLEMQEQGGAVSKIEKVIILNGSKEKLDSKWSGNGEGFGYTVKWTVEGTVEHWGHIHSRTNGYEALFAVKVVEGAWKIVDLQVMNQKRIKFESTLRE